LLVDTLPPHFTILAIETSCDETAAAIVRGGRTVLTNVVASQMDTHRRHGGVVPEVASRQHILSIVPVVEDALAALPEGWNGIHAVACTYGPGLSGALLTGLNVAKAMAWQRGLPFVGVNHIDAHIYANWLTSDSETPPPTFPVIALVVSGGHTLLMQLKDHDDYALLGQTRDDAAGEAFDKVARILNLGYPGGPAIERAAEGGKGGGTLPRAWLRDSYDFSFSGLKTAVLHKVQERQNQEAKVAPAGPRAKRTSQKGGQSSSAAPPASSPPASPSSTDRFTAQIAYAFQESVVDVLVTKTLRAASEQGAAEILLSGGVAANQRLRGEFARRSDVPVRFPPIAFCTDNAAMVGAAAYYRFHQGLQQGWGLDVQPNWAAICQNYLGNKSGNKTP
jgi:N6-L-threonylcarbamoyladenine synthase